MREGKLTDGFEIKPAIQKSINGVFFRPGRLPNPQEKSEVLTAKEIGGPAWNKVTLYERSDELAQISRAGRSTEALYALLHFHCELN